MTREIATEIRRTASSEMGGGRGRRVPRKEVWKPAEKLKEQLRRGLTGLKL